MQNALVLVACINRQLNEKFLAFLTDAFVLECVNRPAMDLTHEETFSLKTGQISDLL